MTAAPPAPPPPVKKGNTLYYLHSTIGLLLIFGFGHLPPFGTVTPVGMQVLGIFAGMIYVLKSNLGKTTAVNPAQKDSQSGIENKSKNPDLSESEMDEIYHGDR